MTQFYIGTKQVTAWPAPSARDGTPGYGVKYEDGYQSWSPKGVFERAYLPMGEESDGTKITQGMVDGFIASVESVKAGEKTTVVTAKLANGFELVESSSCVDPKNYSHEIGTEICVKRIKDRVWHLLGFLLATARTGVTFANTDCKLSEQADTVGDDPSAQVKQAAADLGDI